MPTCDVMLIGFEEVENLGLRSLASWLIQRGRTAQILPYDRMPKEELLCAIRTAQPAIVGFSLIFQRMLHEFGDLISYLRERGVSSHFTMGGHFPTVEPQKTLEKIPGLDTVVRCEGEVTLSELLDSVNHPETWESIKGLTFRKNGTVISTAPQPLMQDLDDLPFVVRGDKTLEHRGIGLCSVVGSRGCYNDCSFCSIRQFYSEAHGPKRRARSPGNVVDEIEALYKERNARIFIFEDDDLVMRGHRQRLWVEDLVAELARRGLADDILWRVSCRVDDIDGRILTLMKSAGLMSVYVGIESGNDAGLATYNKHYCVMDIYRAFEVLKKTGISFEFGFMLLNPDSTMDSLRKDIEFLKGMRAYGDATVHFTKMVPYAGTAIERRLKEEGRLTGGIDSPDYNYLDPRLDLLQLFCSNAFHFRNFNHDGLVERLRHAKFDSLVVEKFFSSQCDASAYRKEVSRLIHESNAACLEALSMAVSLMSTHEESEILQYWPILEGIVQNEKQEEHRITTELDSLTSHYAYHARPRKAA